MYRWRRLAARNVVNKISHSVESVNKLSRFEMVFFSSKSETQHLDNGLGIKHSGAH